MRGRLPEPVPTVRRALKLLPHDPGVYILRERAGRVVYVGRSRDLASRVRSYWIDLRERPHLARMVARVEWVEPVICESEHEAAFLESDLLERHPTRYNRTLGMESCVWLRLDPNPRGPGLEVVHEPDAADGARWFGPYLGWEPTRQAASGLQRVYPLRYSGTEMTRSDRELARSLGVTPTQSTTLIDRISRVLRREPAAVNEARRLLERIRDVAAERLMFEYAAAVKENIRGLRWITEPQKLLSLEPLDGDFGGAATSQGVAVSVVLSLRGGRMVQRHVIRGAGPVSSRRERSGIERAWHELARRNAELMAKLAAAEAVGPLGWRT